MGFGEYPYTLRFTFEKGNSLICHTFWRGMADKILAKKITKGTNKDEDLDLEDSGHLIDEESSENTEEHKEHGDHEPKESEESNEEKGEKDLKGSSGVNELLFKLPTVMKPLVGTPKQVQSELDKIALKIQKRPNSKKNDELFSRIHLYMHGYLLNVVLRQFPYIRGLQTNDIYQEALLAIRFKAIPGFDKTKGMSFLNFAKMCIRRQLITILNQSRHRQKDKSINEAISLDSAPPDDDSGNTFSNIIADETPSVDKKIERQEAIQVTKQTLMNELSDFEKKVLSEYLTSSSYKEIAKNITKSQRRRFTQKEAKAVDNALLRIRKKAIILKKKCKDDDLPLFIK